MKNAIAYYYNLNPNEIHQINKKYKFKIKNNQYILEPFTKEIDELNNIYELQENLIRIGFYSNKIILNKNHEILTNINGENYIMQQVYVENRKIQINDILIFSNLNVNNKMFNKIKRDNWYNLWTNKIDYVEYQISQFGKKYSLVRESSDYYIGIVENCISLLSNIEEKNNTITISHNRTMTTTNLIEYFDPINFIIDNKVRDIAEYIKDCIQHQLEITEILDIIKKYIYYNNLNSYETNLLFIRIMYPSYYLDMCEKILDGKVKEKELKTIIQNIEITENYIRKIYIELRLRNNIPEIEWLIKK